MESTSLQNEGGRGRRYREEEEIVSTSPSTPSSAPKRVARAPKLPRSVSLAKTQRNRTNLPHQRKWSLAEASHRQAQAKKEKVESCRSHSAVPRCRQAVVI